MTEGDHSCMPGRCRYVCTDHPCLAEDRPETNQMGKSMPKRDVVRSTCISLGCLTVDATDDLKLPNRLARGQGVEGRQHTCTTSVQPRSLSFVCSPAKRGGNPKPKQRRARINRWTLPRVTTVTFHALVLFFNSDDSSIQTVRFASGGILTHWCSCTLYWVRNPGLRFAVR